MYIHDGTSLTVQQKLSVRGEGGGKKKKSRGVDDQDRRIKREETLKFQSRARKLQPRCVCKNAGTREQGYDNNRLHCLAVREDDSRR